MVKINADEYFLCIGYIKNFSLSTPHFVYSRKASSLDRIKKDLCSCSQGYNAQALGKVLTIPIGHVNNIPTMQLTTGIS